MSPSAEHEQLKETVALLINIVAEEMGINAEGFGSTTFRRQELERAFEEVAHLEESPERDELTARLIQLSELMGFRVDQIGQGDGEDDDDG